MAENMITFGIILFSSFIMMGIGISQLKAKIW